MDYRVEVVLLALITLLMGFNQGQETGILLVEYEQDFEQLNWYGKPRLPQYAESEAELKEVLPDVQPALGIFYFAGDPVLSEPKIVISLHFKFNINYIALYLKYCLFDTDGSSPTAYVSPAASGEATFPDNLRQILSPTSRWTEVLIELNPVGVWNDIEIGLLNLGSSNYFLLDKIALIYNEEKTIDEIRQVFEQIPTPTTTFSSSSSTAPTEIMTPAPIQTSPPPSTDEAFTSTTPDDPTVTMPVSTSGSTTEVPQDDSTSSTDGSTSPHHEMRSTSPGFQYSSTVPVRPDTSTMSPVEETTKFGGKDGNERPNNPGRIVVYVVVPIVVFVGVGTVIAHYYVRHQSWIRRKYYLPEIENN